MPSLAILECELMMSELATAKRYFADQETIRRVVRAFR